MCVLSHTAYYLSRYQHRYSHVRKGDFHNYHELKVEEKLGDQATLRNVTSRVELGRNIAVSMNLATNYFVIRYNHQCILAITIVLLYPNRPHKFRLL